MRRSGIAVLIPARNAEATIASAVKSTLQALRSSDELLVWDDASTDKTLPILENIRDSRLSVYRGSVQQGVSSSLNELLKRSTAHYVARMDADDQTLPFRFLYERLAIARHDAVFTSIIVREGKSLRFSIGQLIGLSPRAVALWLAIENPLVHPTMLARRTVVESLGGYRDSVAEDYDLWLRMASAGHKIRRLRIPTVVYTRHANQVSTGEYFLRAATDKLADESWRNLLHSLELVTMQDFSDHHAFITRRTNALTETEGRSTSALGKPSSPAFLEDLFNLAQGLNFAERVLIQRRLRTLRSGAGEN